MRHSIRLSPRLLLIGVLGIVVAFAGCGLKGPLYRRGENKQPVGQSSTDNPSAKPPMSERMPAPQSQKTDDTADAPAVDPDRPANSNQGTP